MRPSTAAKRIDQLTQRRDRPPFAIDLLLPPGDDALLDRPRIAAVGPEVADLALQLPLLPEAERREGRTALDLVERGRDGCRVRRRRRQDLQPLVERRHRDPVGAPRTRAQKLPQLLERGLAVVALERGLVDVENQIRRSCRRARRGAGCRREGRGCRTGRSGGRRRRGRPREARAGEVLDRHRAAVDEKLEIVPAQIQNPPLRLVGHDDVDVHDLDVDAFGELLRGGRRRRLLCRRALRSGASASRSRLAVRRGST